MNNNTLFLVLAGGAALYMATRTKTQPQPRVSSAAYLPAMPGTSAPTVPVNVFTQAADMVNTATTAYNDLTNAWGSIKSSVGSIGSSVQSSVPPSVQPSVQASAPSIVAGDYFPVMTQATYEPTNDAGTFAHVEGATTFEDAYAL